MSIPPFHTKNGSRLKDVINVDTSFVEQNFDRLGSLKAALETKLRYQQLLDGKADNKAAEDKNRR